MSTYNAGRKNSVRFGVTKTMLATTALTAAGVLGLGISSAHADGSWANLTATNGGFTTDASNPNITNIDVTTGRASAVGNADIYASDTVNVNASLFAVRDNKADPTMILGKLNSNGKIIVIDGDGVFFGKDSTVDVAGLIATTGDIADDQLMSNNFGEYTISGANTGKIETNGTINIAQAGLAAFVAPNVVNNGVINAKMGTVALAAGEEVTLDMYGDGLFEVSVEGKLANALIENKGTIAAEGGRVSMTALAAKDVADKIVNNEGVITVASATQKGGKIVLSGGDEGTVSVSGTLDASGATGGDIEVTGQFVSAEGSAVLDASGKGDAGTIHFGGDWQGQGDTPTSEYAYVGESAILRANSEEEGDGGEVVVWSDLGTGVYGAIEAKGGANAGNGGNVEVSSLGFYDYRGTVDTTAANGQTGNFLLDPLVVRIIGGNGDGHDNNGANGAGTGGGYTNMGDNLNGFLAYVTTTQDGANPYTIYESEIEAVSATSNITIQATRSIETQAGVGLDNNVTLANNRTLTIQTRNNAGDGAGTINLSNLAFTTSGTGSITVQGSTGTGVSNITTGTLTSGTGGTSVTTDNGSVTINGVVTSTGAVTAGASSAINVNNTVTGSSIALNGPTVNLEANLSSATITGTATTVNVNANGAANGEQINDGVDVAASGATVNVGAGTYEEQVIIDKNLTLRGANAGVNGNAVRGAETIIKAPTTLSTTFPTPTDNRGIIHVVGANNVVIDGVEVDGAGRGNGNYRFVGIGYFNAGGEVKNSIVHGITETPFNGNQHGNAIYAFNLDGTPRNLNVTNNKVYDFQKNGITLNGEGLGGTVSGNIVTGIGPTTITAQNGIQIGYGANGTVSGNTISGIGYTPTSWSASSILIYDAGDDVNVSGNTITGTGVDLGVAVYYTDNAEITGSNQITGSGIGIHAYDSDNLLISGNTVLNSETNGIVVDVSNNVTVSGNTSSGSTDTPSGRVASDYQSGIGILLRDVTGEVVVSGNTTENNTDGIRIQDMDPASLDVLAAGTDYVHVTGNFTNNNQDKGIILKRSDNVFVYDNQVNGNTIGIYADASSNALIKANDINGSTDAGIRLRDGSNSAVIENNWIHGGPIGVHIDNSLANVSGIRIYDNSFAEANGTQANTVNVNNGSGNNVDASFNWWGTTDQAIVDAKIVGGPVDFSPYQGLGVDQQPATPGYQGSNANLYVTTLGSQTSGLIQEAVNAAPVGGTVNLNAGLYTENVNLNKQNLKMNGLTGATVQYDVLNGGINGTQVGSIFTVTASGVNIDPIVFDGNNIANYGIVATGVGFNGFTSDGNTFREFLRAGILLNGSAGTATVTGNTFEGSATRGVEISGLTGGVAAINSNNMGIVGSDVTNGVWASGAITGGIVGIGGNTIEATGAGVLFGQNVSNASVQITASNNITGYDGVEFSGDVTGATINISGGNTIIGNGSANDGDAIDFRRTVVNSNVNINGNTLIRGADDGIQVIGGISGGTFRIGLPGDGSVITGLNGDGINLLSLVSSGFSGNAISNGAQVTIEGNTITGSGPETDGDNGDGTNADGVLVSGNITGATSTLLITGNTITGYDNGVHVFGNVNDATVRVNSNTNIDANDHGIFFDGAINGANVEIDGNTRIFAETDGIRFGGPITGDANVDVTDNGDIEAWSDGISFRGTVGDTASIVIARNDIDADSGGVVGNGIAFYNTVSGQSTIDIDGNTIVADEDGIVFLAQTSNAIIPVTVQDEIQIRNNTITGKKSGIRVAQNVDADRHDIRISGNSILGQTVNGITFDGQIGGLESQIWILDNTSIIGQVDGIHFAQGISDNATLEISDNDFIQGVTDDGINIIGNVKASDVLINNNHQITAATDGIDFNGLIHDGANVEIIGNNAGIAADDHGIYFNADILEGSVVTINDNIVQANLDNAIIGSGIFFNGTVTNATVTIGDGDGATEDGNPSNIITVNANTTIGGGNINNLDGIHFNKEVGTGAVINIDGNRIGYSGTPNSGPANPAAVIADDGIEFRGNITGNADINVTDNHIRSQDDGIVFFGTVGDTANILIGGSGDGNTIDAEDSTSNGNGIVFEKLVDGEALIEISYNNIVADQDGVLFQGETRNALLPGGASQQEIFINENTITGGNNGIRFAQNVATDLHDIRITGNTIDGQNVHGISFDGNIGAESQVWILNNDSIVGDDDGIHVEGSVSSSALVEIVDNTWIEGEDDDAIDFVGNISGNAVVRINGNDNIRADDNADNGIEFAGVSGNAKVEILGNNHGIHADGHGIYFGGNISGNADLDIHDNIINADDNNSGNGDGIRFDGFVSGNSTINIGDGNGLNFSSDPSNIISGEDGIHFNNDIYNSAQIVIDGNRIGYDSATLAGPYFNDRVGDDGIEFADRIYDDANITISDNFIRSDDDGVHFDGDVYGRANILIGGSGDKNTIDANGDGIEFDEDIYQNALINISYNVIDAELDGVRFEGSTSNADTTFPYRDDEILIAYNSIEAGDNGINFLGQASGNRHDIMIRNNTQIHGHDGHGIAHTGGISDAELRILNNDDIFGDIDGIHITGAFTNDALIDIDGNTDIDTNDGDGIEVTQSGGGGGVDLNITRNHIHYVGDNGIEVTNVDGVFIGFNDIHDTDNNGIYVDNSEDAQIRWNDLWAIDEDGIYVEDSESVNIEDNDLWGIGDDGIDVSDSHFAEIEDNDIFFTGGDGIQVRDSSLVQIDDNFIRFAGDDGIDLENSFFSSITDNNIRFTDENGIEVNDSYFILIDNNEVADADEAGIFIDPSAVIFVTNNDVRNNDIGLHVQGPNNGYINVTGNTFTDNRVGARFESGIIDLTNISSDPAFGGFGNKFFGGEVAIEFDAYKGKGGGTTQLSLVKAGGGHTYDGSGYDTWPSVTTPANFGGTLGNQYFEGQSDAFVTLGRETFVDPISGDAIWLDASDSTYYNPLTLSAFSPADTGDILTADQLAFLESMFYHRPDAAGRGIFFFGTLPEDDNQSLNDKDFFNRFDRFRSNTSGLNLTITGLPSVGAPGGYGLNLNNITPFAGGPEDVANIEPAAGDEIQTTAEVQDIEPAAGGEDAACWGQVLNAAVNGAVNYNFTSSPEETLNDSTACGGGTL